MSPNIIFGVVFYIAIVVAIFIAVRKNQIAAAILLPLSFVIWFVAFKFLGTNVPPVADETAKRIFTANKSFFDWIFTFLGFTKLGFYSIIVFLGPLVPAVTGSWLVWRYFTRDGAVAAYNERRHWASVRESERQSQVVYCSNCYWKGTLGRFESRRGCPKCGSDLYISD